MTYVSGMSIAIMIDVGTQLGKYQLLRRVGQGGMSVVYLATDTELGREVAVKVLHNHLAESAEARDRFAREARAVAKLRHRNIVEIYDYAGSQGDDLKASYIVTSKSFCRYIRFCCPSSPPRSFCKLPMGCTPRMKPKFYIAM
jgi:serine/threonine protein kinase